ncbi:MAG: alkylmercury lyase family protein [Promethearchaeota archaeon]|jgi:hypothetical protein
MDSKFGKTLSIDENEIREFILKKSPLLGRIPSIDEIKKEFNQFPKEKVLTILNKLDKLDVIHLSDDKKSINAAYPFSGSKTPQTVKLKGEKYKKIYAMCAIDALGVCFMFGCDVNIDSRCYYSDERIKIEIKDNKIIMLKPKNTIVWCDMEYSSCAATSLCKNINFFSSKSHFAEWRKEKSNRKGYLLTIQEAFYLGKLFFEKRLNFNPNLDI